MNTELFKNILAAVLRVMDPDEWFLGGSRRWNTFRWDSDWDIFVVWSVKIEHDFKETLGFKDKPGYEGCNQVEGFIGDNKVSVTFLHEDHFHRVLNTHNLISVWLSSSGMTEKDLRRQRAEFDSGQQFYDWLKMKSGVS